MEPLRIQSWHELVHSVELILAHRDLWKLAIVRLYRTILLGMGMPKRELPKLHAIDDMYNVFSMSDIQQLISGVQPSCSQDNGLCISFTCRKIYRDELLDFFPLLSDPPSLGRVEWFKNRDTFLNTMAYATRFSTVLVNPSHLYSSRRRISADTIQMLNDRGEGSMFVLASVLSTSLKQEIARQIYADYAVLFTIDISAINSSNYSQFESCIVDMKRVATEYTIHERYFNEEEIILRPGIILKCISVKTNREYGMHNKEAYQTDDMYAYLTDKNRIPDMEVTFALVTPSVAGSDHLNVPIHMGAPVCCLHCNKQISGEHTPIDE
jgi:hypothetical protein